MRFRLTRFVVFVVAIAASVSTYGSCPENPVITSVEVLSTTEDSPNVTIRVHHNTVDDVTIFYDNNTSTTVINNVQLPYTDLNVYMG